MLASLLKGEITQEEYTSSNNINVKLVKMPCYLHGLIFKRREETLIVINKELPYEKAKLALLHEFAHFELHHLDEFIFEYKREDLEDEADRYVEFLLDKE
ncbi:MAG: ImmA/IrrE family metallo-endopeptidase [Bacilli bacterium]|nr:ImmA/IrrE family metallo-endopeptidase [Bacilli bacterium]